MLEIYDYENSICAERVLMTLREKDIHDWAPRHLHLCTSARLSQALAFAASENSASIEVRLTDLTAGRCPSSHARNASGGSGGLM
jgi:hypothetical protein